MQRAENGGYFGKLNCIAVVLCALILLFSTANVSFAADSFSESDLEGDWKFHAIFSSDEGWEGRERADVAVDGETASPSNLEDSDEISAVGSSETVSINSEGVFTFPADTSFEGILCLDKDIIVFTSEYADGDDPELGIWYCQFLCVNFL